MAQSHLTLPEHSSPLLLDVEKGDLSWVNSPFRFQSHIVWLTKAIEREHVLLKWLLQATSLTPQNELVQQMGKVRNVYGFCGPMNHETKQTSIFLVCAHS